MNQMDVLCKIYVTTCYETLGLMVEVATSKIDNTLLWIMCNENKCQNYELALHQIVRLEEINGMALPNPQFRS